MVWEPAATLGERFGQTLAALAALFPGVRRVGRTYQGFIKAWIAWSPRLLLDWEQRWRTLVRQAAGSNVSGRSQFRIGDMLLWTTALAVVFSGAGSLAEASVVGQVRSSS